MANHTIKKDNNNSEIVYINGEMRAYDFNPILEFTVEEVLQIGDYLGVPKKNSIQI